VNRALIIVGSCLGIAFLVLSIITVVTSITTCGKYTCLKFPEKQLWKTLEVYEQTDRAWRGLLTHPSYLIRLEQFSNISPQEASQFNKIRIMKAQGLFESARSPYTGETSQRISCPLKYKPEEKQLTTTEGIALIYYSGYLDDRLQYGACADDQIAYKGYVALFHCDSIRQWYQLEVIVPIKEGQPDDKYLDLFRAVGCERPKLNFWQIFPL